MYNELAKLDPDLKAMLEAQALYLFKGHDLNIMLKKNIDAILFKMMKEIFEQKDGMNDDCYNNLCLCQVFNKKLDTSRALRFRKSRVG